MAGFFAELRRRNVVRAAIAYMVTAWLLAQIADLVLENFSAPEWVMQVLLVLLDPFVRLRESEASAEGAAP